MSKKKGGRWSVLLVTTASTSLVFLDNTIMPVALPTIEKVLHFTPVGAMWIVNVYLLALISLLLIGGRLVDIFGKRPLYFLGFALFGLGSAIGGLSYSTDWLIFSRAVQGMGGAIMLPATGALLMETFPLEERAKALGINTGISSLFLLLGPVLGGFFTDYLSWRVIFWVNLPILLFGFLMSYRILAPEKKGGGTFDFMGAIPLILSVICLVVALMQGAVWGWKSLPILLLFSSTLLLFLFYLRVSKKAQDPIIDFEIFKRPLFSPLTLCIFMTQLSLIVTIQWAIYFQEALQYSPIKTGLLILFATSPVLIMAPLGGILSQYVGPKIPMVLGCFSLIFSLVWMHFFSSDPVVSHLVPGLLAFGCGIPFIFSPAFATAMTHIPPSSLGVASSMITLFRQVGATLGIALMTAVFQSVHIATGSYSKAFSSTLFMSIGFALAALGITLFGLRKKDL